MEELQYNISFFNLISLLPVSKLDEILNVVKGEVEVNFKAFTEEELSAKQRSILGALYKQYIPTNPCGQSDVLDIRFMPLQLEDLFAKTLYNHVGSNLPAIITVCGISGGGKTGKFI